ncbi:MAG: c-type cytochrome domain-containing protein, partial [Planctomycetota bacterium]
MKRLVGWLTLICATTCSVVDAEDVDFSAGVEPILRKHCYRCHAGQNEESGLRLDRADRLLGE